MLTGVLILAVAAAAALLASLIMTRASSRSALWNMGLGAILAVAVIICALAIAWWMARST